MSPNVLRTPSGLSFFLSLSLGWLILFATAHAQEPARPSNNVHPITLSQLDTQYPLESLIHSSGFIPAPEKLKLENAPESPPDGRHFGLSPDFKQHKRYWLYTQVTNDTKNENWMLHVSNFSNVQPQVLVRNVHGQQLKSLFKPEDRLSTDINTTGRATAVTLQPGDSYQIIVELDARFVAIQPYIGLMSLEHYRLWTAQMDYTFKLAIGVVVGLVLVGLACWLLTSESVFLWAALSSLLLLAYYLAHSSLPAIFWQSNYERTVFFWILVSSTLIAHLKFAAAFLRIKRSSKGWYFLFLGAGTLTLLVGITTAIVPIQTSASLVSINYFVVFAVIIGSVIAKIRSEGRYYIVYLLGWLIPLLSVAHVVLAMYLPQEQVEEITPSYKIIIVLYGLILHMFLHAIALILMVRKMRVEKLKTEFVSQAKSRFIAQSSHDLSQPLNAMSLFLEHLKPHVRGLDGKKIFYRLENTHRQMSESFKSILDLSKLESGGIKPAVKPVSISEIFSRLQHEYWLPAAEKNVRLTFRPSSVKVVSDPVLLERMLRNLVSNAVKYTAEGRVLVGCRRQGKNVRIEVWDTGCGVDEEAQKHIFDIYHRSARDPELIEGSGIGLSIVRHLSELLHHPVAIESLPGRGSRFTITLRRLEAGHQSGYEAGTHSRAPVVALVMGTGKLRDDVVQRLHQWGCSLKPFDSLEAVCESGEEATLLLCESASLERTALSPDALCMLARKSLAGCVCNADTPLPENWVALSSGLLPSQLRALLNVAARQRPSETGASSHA